MKTPQYPRSIVLLIFIGLMTCSALHGAILTHSVSFSNFEVNAGAQNSPPLTVVGTFSDENVETLILSLPSFDSDLGTLLSVSFKILFTTSSTNALFDVSGTTTLSSITLNRSLSLSINSGAFPTPLVTNTANLSNVNLANLLGITLGPEITVDADFTGEPSVSDFSTIAYTDLAQLSAVTDTENLALTIEATDFYEFTSILGLGSTSWGGTSTYSGVGEVTYEYIPAVVPEPNVVALMFVSLCIGLISRQLLRAKKLNSRMLALIQPRQFSNALFQEKNNKSLL